MNDEPDEDYEFDYSQAQPNRFASEMQIGGRVIILEPDVAAVFRESETVNAVLKALLKTMPTLPPSIPDAA